MDSTRIFGLDIMRCAAILIVMLFHSLPVFDLGLGGFSLPDGVDIFFVLSGFLIGNILLRLIEKNNGLDLKTSWYFWKRRWFRTLPNYYLFLIINIVLVSAGLANGFINKFLVTYFCFMQYVYKPFDFIYWESWSLCVEEWFYFLFPLGMVILFTVFKRKTYKQVFLITTLVFIILPLLIRFERYDSTLDTDLFFRKLVITRLDSIGFGLLSAYLYSYHQYAWRKWRQALFIIGITSALLIYNFRIVTDNVFFGQTIYFTISCISIAMTLPFLSSLKEEKIPLKPVRFISVISYSLYLVHIPVLSLIKSLFHPISPTEKLTFFLIFWPVTILISATIYFLFEKPLTLLRES